MFTQEKECRSLSEESFLKVVLYYGGPCSQRSDSKAGISVGASAAAAAAATAGASVTAARGLGRVGPQSQTALLESVHVVQTRARTRHWARARALAIALAIAKAMV